MITIDKSSFREFLEKNTVASVLGKVVRQSPIGENLSLSLSEIKRRTDDFAGGAKGKLFEYIVYKWLLSSQFLDCRCDYYLGDEQIDCSARKDGIQYVFECKLNAHEDDIEAITNQCLRKAEALKREAKKDIQPCLVAYQKLSDAYLQRLSSKGIDVIDDFKMHVREEKDFMKSTRQVFSILEFNFEDSGFLLDIAED